MFLLMSVVSVGVLTVAVVMLMVSVGVIMFVGVLFVAVVMLTVSVGVMVFVGVLTVAVVMLMVSVGVMVSVASVLSEVTNMFTFPDLNGTNNLTQIRLDRASIQVVPPGICNHRPWLKSL